MTTKYTVTFKGKQKQISVTVAYDENGCLHSLVFSDPDNTRAAVGWILHTIPATENDLGEIGTIAIVEPIPQDLSFNVFWEAYAHKIGDKTRTLKLWAALTEEDRIKCLRSIPRYNQWLKQRPSMERLYPETFLKQERYRNEFKV